MSRTRATIWALALTSAALAMPACTRHRIEVEPTRHTIEIKPLYMTIDVNIRVQRELDEFFAPIEQSGAPTEEPTEEEQP